MIEVSQLRPAPPYPVRVLLRHADAGMRAQAREPDAWRALSLLGWRQADDVIDRLRGLNIVRVFAGPALRCRQTVVPLARALSVDVEPRPELAIDADPRRLLEFLRMPETETAVLCTHRETLGRFFALVTLPAGQARAVTGATGAGAAPGPPVIRYLPPGLPV
jgi:8-oxo-dGTP diphosphatase